MPGALHLHSVDADAVFGKDTVRDAVHVERFFLVTWLLAQIALFATLWVYARRGPRLSRESAAGPIGTGMLLGMLGLGIVWLVQLPFRLLDVWWARRHDLTESGYLDWAFGHWVELGGDVRRDLHRAPRRDVPRAPARRDLVDPRRARLRRDRDGIRVRAAVPRDRHDAAPGSRASERRPRTIEREQGVSGIPVSVEDVSGTTSQANAFAVGFGPLAEGRALEHDGRRQLLGRRGAGRARARDRPPLERAHPEGPRLVRLFALPGAWVLMRVTRRRGGMGEAAAVPLALLVVAVLQLALAPAQAWISRRMEAEADWKALQTTRDPAAARRLFVDFAKTALANPDPPAWAHVLLDSHPTLAQRVAMADAWRARNP